MGKFPFVASGKAVAGGATEGFVKVIYDAKYRGIPGCHMIGSNVTEMIAEAVTANWKPPHMKYSMPFMPIRPSARGEEG